MTETFIQGIPRGAFFAECHTFAGAEDDTDRAYPHICCAEGCPARPYVRAAGEPMLRVVDL